MNTRVRYYVLARDNGYEVLREDVGKGSSNVRQRAVELARSLARLEPRFTRAATEVVIEDRDGCLRSTLRFDPTDDAAPRGGVLVMGDEGVLVR